MKPKCLIQLREILDRRFDEGELRTLCFHLGVDYDDLPGQSKADRARELILHCERRECVAEFVAVGKKLRPDISWPSPTEVKARSWFQSQHHRTQAALATAALLMAVSLIVTVWLLRTPAATPSPTPTPDCSPYQRATDAATIIRMIQAEAEAVNVEGEEGISIIRCIFDERAHIRDEASGEEWYDPVARYEALFANADYVDAENVEIQPAGAGIMGDAAWFTSESQGTAVVDGVPVPYFRTPHECHWTLRKDESGYWVITSFVFNASGVPFPP